MQNDLDIKFLLAVFEKIRQHGEHKGESHILNGVRAYTDFDGYTVYLEDALVSLRCGFHNQYHYTYESSEHLAAFQKKLQSIHSEYA